MPTRTQFSIVKNTYDGATPESPWLFNMAEQVVPRFPSFGYAALTHGGAGNGLGYYNVSGAYPEYSGSCTRYGVRSCNGLVRDPSTFPVGHPPNLPSALFMDSGGKRYQPPPARSQSAVLSIGNLGEPNGPQANVNQLGHHPNYYPVVGANAQHVPQGHHAAQGSVDLDGHGRSSADLHAGRDSADHDDHDDHGDPSLVHHYAGDNAALAADAAAGYSGKVDPGAQ